MELCQVQRMQGGALNPSFKEVHICQARKGTSGAERVTISYPKAIYTLASRIGTSVQIVTVAQAESSWKRTLSCVRSAN